MGNSFWLPIYFPSMPAIIPIVTVSPSFSNCIIFFHGIFLHANSALLRLSWRARAFFSNQLRKQKTIGSAKKIRTYTYASISRRVASHVQVSSTCNTLLTSPFRFLTLPGRAHLRRLQFLEQRDSRGECSSSDCNKYAQLQ